MDNLAFDFRPKLMNLGENQIEKNNLVRILGETTSYRLQERSFDDIKLHQDIKRQFLPIVN